MNFAAPSLMVTGEDPATLAGTVLCESWRTTPPPLEIAWQARRALASSRPARSSMSSSFSPAGLRLSLPSRTVTWQVAQASLPPHSCATSRPSSSKRSRRTSSFARSMVLVARNGDSHHFQSPFSARGEAAQPIEQGAGQELRARQQRVLPGAEHAVQVARGRAVDGEAEGRDALQARLDHRLTHVLDAVAALVMVDVVRLAVGEQQQQAVADRLAHQQRAGVAQRRADARVALGLERGDAPRHPLAVLLVERLHAAQRDRARAFAG